MGMLQFPQPNCQGAVISNRRWMKRVTPGLEALTNSGTSPVRMRMVRHIPHSRFEVWLSLLEDWLQGN